MLTCDLPHSDLPVAPEHAFAMLKCMEKYMALGLAANQVGYPFRIITVAPNLVMIEPEILETKGELVANQEACLSIPKVICTVERAIEEVTVRYHDIWYIQRENKFHGMTARVIQHEIDHLNGVLMTERGMVMEV